jgi:hypothetical protein
MENKSMRSKIVHNIAKFQNGQRWKVHLYSIYWLEGGVISKQKGAQFWAEREVIDIYEEQQRTKDVALRDCVNNI